MIRADPKNKSIFMMVLFMGKSKDIKLKYFFFFYYFLQLSYLAFRILL